MKCFLLLASLWFTGVAAQQCTANEIPWKYYYFDSVGAVTRQYRQMDSADVEGWQVMYVLSGYKRAFAYYLVVDSSGHVSSRELTEKGEELPAENKPAVTSKELYRLLGNSATQKKYYYLTCATDRAAHWGHVLIVCNKALGCRIEIFAPSGQIGDVLYQQVPFFWGRELVEVFIKAFPEMGYGILRFRELKARF